MNHKNIEPRKFIHKIINISNNCAISEPQTQIFDLTKNTWNVSHAIEHVYMHH